MSDIKTLSGKGLDELNLEGLMQGELGPDDVRISPETLISQAEKAETAGNAALGANFRRAAELTALSHAEVLDIYDALRPGRRTRDQLLELARHLEQQRGAPLNAALVREAAQVYALRGLVRAE